MSLARTQPCVLFVEDDEDLRLTFATLLRRFGLDIDTADCFAAAKSYLEQNVVSGLITDEHLGDGKGMDLANLALARNPHARVAIVTGNTPRIPASLQGRVLMLQKPFSTEDLRRFLKDFPRSVRPA
jgi:two-component system, NtrC family, response regulator PilR